ncbi:MAG TPA: right-handed parallel beta-helix repeat-containing protein [bacterium]|nr:right-handed parallel beta-helix repeat-containing protein [bacterium]
MIRIAKCAFIIALAASLSAKGQGSGYTDWLKRRDALKSDPSVARYYTFEDVSDSKSIVKDLSGNGGDLKFFPFVDEKTKETFDDLKIIEGRWPEKKAVSLDRGWYQGKPVEIVNKNFTVEIWMRKNGPGSITVPPVGKRGYIVSGPAGWGAGWRIKTEYSPSKFLTFDIGIPRNNVRAKSDKMYSDGIWHHVAATWDGRDMKLYVDGELAASREYSGEYYPGKAPFRIGFRSGGSVLLDIDEVVIYNRALSAEEISKTGKGDAGVSPQEAFSRAGKLIKSGDYEGARKLYEKLKNLPSFGKEMALFSIAESYRIQKDHPKALKTYGEILKLEKLTPYYRIHCLFRQADVYLEEKNYDAARSCYKNVTETAGALKHHIFTARMKTGDTYRDERKYGMARDIYCKLLAGEESASYPHDGYRLDLRDRLTSIDGAEDGKELKNSADERRERVNKPRQALYVSVTGNDGNQGTREHPFRTVERARQEVRKIKEAGMPGEGLAVYLRGGKYFLSESISLDSEDSGQPDAPVVYRSFPGETARLIGGRQVDGFRLLTDPAELKKLPEEARGKVWVANLKESGITDYGTLLNRGGYCYHGKPNPAAMELFFEGKSMQLARWPNQGYERVTGFPKPDGFDKHRKANYQKGTFCYPGDRPLRWLGEKEIWLHGYWYFEYSKDHVKVAAIDPRSRSIKVHPDIRWWETYPLYAVPILDKAPFYAYNILMELDAPGEWYLDRDTGRLYFYPPGDIEKSEVLVSTLDAPVISMNNVSNITIFGLTIEAGRRNGIEIEGGTNNMVAGCVIRNTGQSAVIIENGWNHAVTGCDMYGMGEGGVSLNGGDRKKLIPACHTVENNHIHDFNRFDGGYRHAVKVDGIGQRISRNVISGSPMQAIHFNANDNIIEFNELYDSPYEGREIGCMYVYGESYSLMNRGNIIRNNFFHHISYHSSPNLTQGLCAIHLDAVNAGIVMEKNFFYRFPAGISSTHPGNRIENNIFLDAATISISQGDRTSLFHKNGNPDDEPNFSSIANYARILRSVNYKQPPWSYRYPQLAGLMAEPVQEWAKNRGSVIERNLNKGGKFISYSRGASRHTLDLNNMDSEEILFADEAMMDFSIPDGDPVYGLTGFEPLDMNKIGVYRDELRASWPINREPVKYYKTDWKRSSAMSSNLAPLKRVSKALEYTVRRTEKPVVIDGRLDPEEWMGLGEKDAMIIKQYYTGEDKTGPASRAWMVHDDRYLYVAMTHDADPWKEGMPVSYRDKFQPVVEMVFEGQAGPSTKSWWREDMVTGPLYILWFLSDGKFEVKNNFGMPHASLLKLQSSIKYRATMIDPSTFRWVSEIMIPLVDLGIDPAEAGKLSFNIGIGKRPGWFAWVATGDSIWRVENAGFIKFEK